MRKKQCDMIVSEILQEIMDEDNQKKKEDVVNEIYDNIQKQECVRGDEILKIEKKSV